MKKIFALRVPRLSILQETLSSDLNLNLSMVSSTLLEQGRRGPVHPHAADNRQQSRELR